MDIFEKIRIIEDKRSELRGKMHGVNATECKALQSTYAFAYERLTLKVRALYHSPEYLKAYNDRKEAYDNTPVAQFLRVSKGMNGQEILIANNR